VYRSPYSVSGFVFWCLVAGKLITARNIIRHPRLDEVVGKEWIVNDMGKRPITLRFWNVVGGLASSLHPLLGFDKGPCLDTGGARNASARNPCTAP
jgi:hypothetical protein